MTQKSADTLDALGAIEKAVLGVFRQAGGERVAPDILQPADPFLDRLGESIRARTYVFTDPGGAELCLRPDFTLPVARIYLARNPDCLAPRCYSYSGPAFRYQNKWKIRQGHAANATAHEAARTTVEHPREFEQIGIECFHYHDFEAADARIAGLSAKALRQAGLTGFTLHLGDPGIFRALLEQIEMPPRWRRRLLHKFWRPDAFHALLVSLGEYGAAMRARSREKELLEELAALSPKAVARRIDKTLEAQNIPLFGGRSVEEIAARMLEHAADRAAEALADEHVRRIQNYLQISGNPRKCLETISALTQGDGIDLGAALTAFARRLDLLEAQGFDLDTARFDTEFGRQFEYYSGFVFQLEAPAGFWGGPLAGGGRYDDLLQELGAPHKVPAVGAALHPERILAARKGMGR